MFQFGGWELYKTGDSETPFAVVTDKKRIYLMDEVGLISKKTASTNRSTWSQVQL
jgi:hypothetical protein